MTYKTGSQRAGRNYHGRTTIGKFEENFTARTPVKIVVDHSLLLKQQEDPVLASSDELDNSMIPENLELLADLRSNVPILRMEFLETTFERVNIFKSK